MKAVLNSIHFEILVWMFPILYIVNEYNKEPLTIEMLSILAINKKRCEV